ncbi:hypothetical protein [Nesterenkonia ebinurensis]|uniref:hypothetical protein n=1 Tax=Nesterenkonia ebinurensis TaxID=2608252 RepID=UPI00123CDE9F|nr:hypothetical protein [Nesterenkonia ebinurensis]
MIWTAQASTIPQQLYTAADAYDDAAGRLRRVLAKVPDYFAQIDAAERVHWDSMASRTFRTALEALRIPGEFLTAESAALAAQAEAVAADLRSYGDQARYVMSLISTGTHMVGQGIELAQQQTAQAFVGYTLDIFGSNDAVRFIQFAQQGGLSQMLGLPQYERGIPIGTPGSPAAPTH